MSRTLTAIALILLVALTGCQKEDAASIKLRSDYLPAAADGVFFAVTASGAWSLSIEFPAGTEAWAKVSPSSGNGSLNNAILSFEANPHKENRGATIVLTPASGAPDRVSITQAGSGIDWLELPDMPATSSRTLLIHNMQGGKYRGKLIDSDGRNWSCYYDYDHRMSIWVAYPLNNGLIGSGERSNSWGYDPLLPVDQQQSITRSFPSTHRYYSDRLYDRGHQIPSADRLRYSANVSTFYPTNMTPQANDFNGKIWATLEGKVRNYAKMADTLYVVTGCLIDGSTVKVQDVAGHSLPVPTHYFKALLYKGKSAYAKDTDGFLMTGFLLPHDNGIAEANCLSYRMSIDELEAQTGIDFFPNLEKRSPELAQQLEAAEPNALFWN